MSAATPAAPQAQTCAVASMTAREQAVGSATSAAFWVAIEQPGAWGRDAVGDATGPGIQALQAVVAAAGGRLLLIRSPGRHPAVDGPRRLLIASCEPGSPWLVSAVVPHDGLPEVNLPALAAALRSGPADVIAALAPVAPHAIAEHHRVLLLCTNGRRDQCCAALGRPIAATVMQTHPGRVWETSHTGGHRFSPTGVLLPDGLLLGRLDARTAAATLSPADAPLPAAVLDRGLWRGHSWLTPRHQVAELAVREQIGDLNPGAYRCRDSAELVKVTDHEGRRWSVQLVTATSPLPRPPSCGKAPEPVQQWIAGEVVRG